MISASVSFSTPPCAARPATHNAPGMNQRFVLIVASVLAFHALALWALQAGFVRRAVDQVVPAAVMVEFITLPQPQATPVPVPAPPTSASAPKPVIAEPRSLPKPKPTPKPLPTPVAEPDPLPTTTAPIPDFPPPPLATAASTPAAAVSARPSASPAPPAPPAPPKIELPTSRASYLNNPRPPYPSLSKRLGEQGRVVIQVLISAEGTASQASVKTSSGYHRLDQTALQTVLQWRYVPGKRAGAPEAMWFDVPLDFVLE